MCVYSQEAEVTRDALAGEPLKVCQFTHAVGLCPAAEPGVAACVRPGSTIEFDKVIRYSRPLFMGLFWYTVVTEHTTAKLIQLNEHDPRLKSVNQNADAHYFRDWLELPDGTLVCLNRLIADQVAQVHDPVKKLLDEANAVAKGSRAIPEGDNGVEPCGFHREGRHQPNREGWLAPTRT